MCTYNGEQFLPAQLESIGSQTQLPDELVICDDASTDGTVEIVKQYSITAPFPVRLTVNEQNIGVVKNFESAIRQCEGAIIALSDQDDVWLPHKLQRLAATMSSTDAGLVFSDAYVVDHELTATGRRLWEFTFSSADREMIEQGNAVSVFLKRSIITGATMAFQSRFRDVLLPIPSAGHLVHDDWIALIVSASAAVAFIDEPLMKYRQHANQLIGVFERTDNSQSAEPSVRAESLHSMASFYRTLVERYQTAIDRLRMLPQSSTIERSVSLISLEVAEFEQKVAHFLCRAEMAEHGMRRLPAAIKELCQLGYHRHSNGFLSFAKDVLR